MSLVRTSNAAALTDPGLTRTGNEDAFLFQEPLFAVADGMGGHSAGEIASRVAVQELLQSAPRAADPKALGRAVRAANRAVIESAGKSRTRTGMGTTLTAAMVDGRHIAIAHVGDSRAYLLHAGRLERITEDHSMVADLVRQGSITEEDARFHPQRSVITRALGSDPEMVADIYEATASPGDRLLLCTDGLSGMMTDDFIADILIGEPDPGEAATRLIEAANRAGGYDNITVVVVDITGEACDPCSPAKGTVNAGRRGASRLLWIVAALALVGVTGWFATSYAWSQAYLVDEGGFVAVYEGIPGSFAGLRLHRLVEVTDVPVSALDGPKQSRLREGIQFGALEDALMRVTALRAASQVQTLTAPSVTSTPATP
jgi:protein phosphatase